MNTSVNSFDSSAWFDQELGRVPVMAVLRGLSPEETVRLAEIAWDIGCDHVEVPIESPAAVPSLIAAVAAGRTRGKIIGAGTILTRKQVDTALELGVEYLVSPGLDPDLIAYAHERRLPFLPGVATASEILRARSIGLRWLKAFPASLLGAEWFTAMAGPFPDINFVATGGMNANNASAYIEAGVRVIGVSSALASVEDRTVIEAILGEYV